MPIGRRQAVRALGVVAAGGVGAALHPAPAQEAETHTEAPAALQGCGFGTQVWVRQGLEVLTCYRVPAFGGHPAAAGVASTYGSWAASRRAAARRPTGQVGPERDANEGPGGALLRAGGPCACGRPSRLRLPCGSPYCLPRLCWWRWPRHRRLGPRGKLPAGAHLRSPAHRLTLTHTAARCTCRRTRLTEAGKSRLRSGRSPCPGGTPGVRRIGNGWDGAVHSDVDRCCRRGPARAVLLPIIPSGTTGAAQGGHAGPRGGRSCSGARYEQALHPRPAG